MVTGEPCIQHDPENAEERTNFLLGMLNLALLTAPRFAAEIDLGGRTHLLDIGGGPGTYAIHFCQANPRLRATLFDRSTTEPIAAATVRQYGMEERIRFTSGDFTTDPLPKGDYDVVWMSHVLHGLGPDASTALIGKCAEALTPGGMILIHDFFLDETKDGPEFAALFALNMLVNNPAGRTYSEGEVRDMLLQAGVVGIRRFSPLGPNNSSIIHGVC